MVDDARAPSLRPGVAVIPMDGAVQLRLGDEEVVVLRSDAPGPLLRAIERLDGRHDRGALADAIGSAAELDELLGALEGAGLLAAPGAAVDDLARYLGPDPAAAVRAARVGVVGGAPSAGLLVDVLGEHGMDASSLDAAAAPSGLDVIACAIEAPDLSLLFAVNDAACAAAVACLFVDLSHGRHATVGPFFVPGEGACYRCFRARLRENTSAFAELRAAEDHMLETGAPLPAYGCLPAHRHVVAGLAAAEIVAFFAQHRPLRTLSRAITVSLENVRTWSEPVFRVPWCAACGAAPGPA